MNETRTKELARIPLPWATDRSAHINPEIVVQGLDDGCKKLSRLVIRPVRLGVYAGNRFGVYEIRSGNNVVGIIEGRFPENIFGVR
jgi:hypothetical protein